jgi:ParB-like chromosome segregation protein Spo0J
MLIILIRTGCNLPQTGLTRSDDDIQSVDYCQSQIREGIQVTHPIWLLLQKNGKYLLLDGAHRIVASYILDQPYIPAFVISSSSSFEMIKN